MWLGCPLKSHNLNSQLAPIKSLKWLTSFCTEWLLSVQYTDREDGGKSEIAGPHGRAGRTRDRGWKLDKRQGRPSGIREHARYSGQSQGNKSKQATLSQGDVLIAYSHLQCPCVPNPRTACNHLKTTEKPRCGGKKKVGGRPQVKTSPVYFDTHLLIVSCVLEPWDKNKIQQWRCTLPSTENIHTERTVQNWNTQDLQSPRVLPATCQNRVSRNRVPRSHVLLWPLLQPPLRPFSFSHLFVRTHEHLPPPPNVCFAPIIICTLIQRNAISSLVHQAEVWEKITWGKP